MGFDLDGTSIVFHPLVPVDVLWLLTGLSVLVWAFALWRRTRAPILRGLALLAFLGILAGPEMVSQKRQYHPDVVVALVDRSSSQKLEARTAQTDEALARLRSELRDQNSRQAGGQPVELRVVDIGDDPSGDGTRAFAALEQGLEGIDRNRLAGVVFITDGRVHDMAAFAGTDLGAAPLHTLLTGRDGEQDRHLHVASAPAFGIVGDKVKISVSAHVAGPDTGPLKLTIRRDGVWVGQYQLPVGKAVPIDVLVSHAGDNLFELQLEEAAGELTLVNNRAAIRVNGIRDRLRVLLVSGEPYAGERTWRNLLKSDPAVDLVHFTILRPPVKQDATPIHELALISFPIRELFELKLHEFDLIVFDRFKRSGILHFAYLGNIVNYVRDGGALLDASGPAFAGPQSIYRSPLGRVLPARPTGDVTVGGYRPLVSDTGRRHPITAGLSPRRGRPPWGRWFRIIDAATSRGNVLMHGPGDRPLLVVDRVGDGRVAQFMSDQAWLWARGFEGGGPQAEIMRRTAHWLMKEPGLEEEALTASVSGGALKVEYRSLEPGNHQAAISVPDGTMRSLPLLDQPDGPATGLMKVDVPGLYRIEADGRQTLALLGNINPVEFSRVTASDELLRPVVQQTGGALLKLSADPDFRLRMVEPGDRAAGGDWLGLRRNGAFDVTGLSQVPLLPPLLVMLLLLALSVVAWWREGR